VIKEPHTIDKHDFKEDCPDCGSLCADALVEIVEWLTANNKRRTTSLGRVAALVVVTKKMTAKEASEWFGVTERRINQNKKILAKSFGLKLRHGKLR